MAGWDKRGQGRFEVRVFAPGEAGKVSRTVTTRTSKLEVGLMGLADLARRWANAHGAVNPGTVADLVDTTDGGTVAQLKWLGFEEGTLDSALNALQANGFGEIERVAPVNESLTKLI